MDFSMSTRQSPFAVTQKAKAPLLWKTRARFMPLRFTTQSETHRHHNVFVVIVAAFGRTELGL